MGRGPESLHARLEGLTADFGRVIPEVDLVFVVSAGSGHESMSEACAPHLRDGQAAVFLGGGGGSLVLRKVLRDRGVHRDVLLGETNNLPYMARLQSPGRVTATRKIGGTLFAAYPGKRTAELAARLGDLWPYLTRAGNVLEVIVTNFDTIDRVAPMLCNAGWLETCTTLRLLYGEGVGPGVARVIEAVDTEILAVRAALGSPDRTPYRDFLVRQGLLDAPQPTTYDAIRRSALSGSTFQCAPDVLTTRTLPEDIPYPTVLIASIADAVGVETPVIDGLIALASAINGENYRARGRTLERLGLGGLDRDALLRAVTDGG
jgi:opine dehydrogenase